MTTAEPAAEPTPFVLEIGVRPYLELLAAGWGDTATRVREQSQRRRGAVGHPLHVRYERERAAELEGEADTLDHCASILRGMLSELGERTLVPLTPDARAVIAGAVAPSSEGVYVPGVLGPWDEVHAAFPVEVFRTWADERPSGLAAWDAGAGYDPEAGE